ncbi:MAG: LacI family DNA-binding transcriptional regulator [Propionicimonas sp.]
MNEPKPGPATIYAVAERAGVSIATVSRVLQGTNPVSGPTRERVLEAARSLDYLPRGSARALAAKKHEAVGLMVPELTGPYFAELLVGFEFAAAERGLSVALLMTEKHGLSRPLRQLAARVDGLAIMTRPNQLETEEVESLARRLPLVMVASGPHQNAISTENVTSARELTEHLFVHGRHRLVFVGDPDLAPDAAERFAGFAAAHTAAGMPTAEPIRIGFSEEDGRSYVRHLLGTSRDDWPDGLVCVNDEVAVAALDELQNAGVGIPDDLAITGWDDVMTARYTRPRLTTVAQPVRELGRLAATTLTQIISDGTPAAGHSILPTRIVLRGSCGCQDTWQPQPTEPGLPRQAGQER